MVEDLTSKKFGEWIVLEYVGVDKFRKKTWKCKCHCGAIQNKSGNILKSGRTTQCRKCKDKNQIIDLVGKKFGKWTVVKMTDKDIKNDCLVWDCICECGSGFKVRGTCLLSKKSKQCVNCSNLEMISKDIIPNFIYNRIKKGALSRNKKFEITKEYLEKLFLEQKEKCALSGFPISIRKTKNKNLASLDRIDSNQGYIFGNVQWVDKQVNFMKQNLSEEKFLFYCNKIINYQNSLKIN